MRKKIDKETKIGARKRRRDEARARSRAAGNIADAARSLKAEAEQGGFSMIVYLLNLVELEAMDRQKAIDAKRRSGSAGQA